MSLNKLRTEIRQLREDLYEDEEVTLQSFYRWCEEYYGRKVDIAELHLSKYYIDGELVESDQGKFLRLSDEYFRKIHNTSNPVKDGEYGLKFMLSGRWWDANHFGEAYNRDAVMSDPEYSVWFEDAWQEFIATDDLSVFSKY